MKVEFLRCVIVVHYRQKLRDTAWTSLQFTNMRKAASFIKGCILRGTYLNTTVKVEPFIAPVSRKRR